MPLPFLIFLLFCVATSLRSQTIYQFRGPNHSGVYPNETILPEWPPEGLKLLWMADSLGDGYGSPQVTANRIYISGEIDSVGYLYCLNLNGELIWKTSAGWEWGGEFPGPRSTPTVVGDLVYTLTGLGELICLNAATGAKIWSVNLEKDLHGRNIRFGYTESPAIHGDLLFCSPGGPDTNIVALNRFTGSMVWKSSAAGDSTAYCTPAIVSLAGRKLLVTLTMHHLVGLDIKDGRLLWAMKYDRPNDIHCNTPLYENGFLYVNNRGGNGFQKLAITHGGDSIREVWRIFRGANVQSGFVKLGLHLYGSRYSPKRFEAVDALTGEITDSLKFNVGATISAGGMIINYNEKGEVGLIRPDNGKVHLVSRFTVTAGTKEHFAHPVVAGGILYIRRGNVLLAYQVK